MHAFDLAKFVQTPSLVVVLVELSVPGVRQIMEYVCNENNKTEHYVGR